MGFQSEIDPEMTFRVGVSECHFNVIFMDKCAIKFAKNVDLEHNFMPLFSSLQVL